MIYKQWVGDADAIRLVGFMKGVIIEDDVLGIPEHGLLSNFFRDGCLIKRSIRRNRESLVRKTENRYFKNFSFFLKQ